MAIPGPVPKAPGKRAHKGGAAAPLRVVEAAPSHAPDLPEHLEERVYDESTGGFRTVEFEWPEITRQWWQMWIDSPLSDEFTEVDWSELLITARIHAKFWTGDHKVAAELRQRTNQFGATPEARAKLRITFAQADNAEETREVKASSRDRAKGRRLKGA